MKIKGWKKLDKWLKNPVTGRKIKSDIIIYQSSEKIPSQISIKRMYIPKTDIFMYWSVKIWKPGKRKPFLDKPFETKKKALSFAVKWMRLHPEGK